MPFYTCKKFCSILNCLDTVVFKKRYYEIKIRQVLTIRRKGAKIKQANISQYTPGTLHGMKRQNIKLVFFFALNMAKNDLWKISESHWNIGVCIVSTTQCTVYFVLDTVLNMKQTESVCDIKQRSRSWVATRGHGQCIIFNFLKVTR